MRLRALLRTHYQVDHPGHFLILVQECTSPIRSDHAERIATRLASAAQFNEAAALYAIELARHAEILTDRMVWTPLALMMALLARPAEELRTGMLNLTTAERFAVFRAFLESDGACLLWLARRLLSHQSISATEDASNPIARDMFLEIYAQYLDVMQSPSERQNLRASRDRLGREGFNGKTGKHKLWLHLELLASARLCNRTDDGGSRHYVADQELQLAGLRCFCDRIDGVLSLEQHSAAGDLGDIGCDVLRTTLNLRSERPLIEAEFRGRLEATVRRIRRLGINLCSISVLLDVVRTQATIDGLAVPKSEDLMKLVLAMHRNESRRVRIHVDRRGRPAYLMIDD